MPWLLLAATVFTLFFALGGRALNEPDEGRYAEIAREMLERHDWVVPHLWYEPHLDKPPLAYWTVGASLALFGANEWAVRLPLALAGMSGVAAAYLFARSIGGPRAGFWAGLILQTSMLYYVMARMLTTDIFLSQFVAWAAYFFWQSWTVRLTGGQRTWFYICAGWLALAFAFLCKGPIALAVVLVPWLAMVIFRRRGPSTMSVSPSGKAGETGTLLGATLVGLGLFAVVALPWFLAVFSRVPRAVEYMVFGQALGHALGTAIKDRAGHPLYFVAILVVGFLPWTPMLGWLWRRRHWQTLSRPEQDAWLFLSVWALFPLLFFSLSRAKLPAYILPMFPPLAILAALRWFQEPGTTAASNPPTAPRGLWLACAVSAAAAMIVFPGVVWAVFKPEATWRLAGQAMMGALLLVMLVLCRRRLLASPGIGGAATASLAVVNLSLFALAVPSFETALKSNQTLKPIGMALREQYRPGDAVVCWGRFPQGLPFYACPAIGATNRPYFGGMALDKVPFESAGNRERFAPWLLADEQALARRLASGGQVWVVSPAGLLHGLNSAPAGAPLHVVLRSGQWELLSNRAAR